jgi:hypothetical protein
MKKALALLAGVLAIPASAATAWTINTTSGGAVMGELSTITFTVKNTSTAPTTNRLSKIVLQLPNAGNSAKDYNLDSGLAPAGWVVSTVDKQNRAVTFTTTTCASALAPGASANFGVRVVAAQTTADLVGESLIANKTNGYDTCSTPNVTFNNFAGNPTWRRYGLSASLIVSPRTLDIGGNVTVTLTVTNRSTATQSGITGARPTSPGLNFGFLTGPTPATLSLAADQSGTQTWTFVANQRGVTQFQDSAANTAVSSLTVQSLEVDVGTFPASVTLSPTEAATGQTVSVRLVVSNNTTDNFTAVAPNTPVVSGTATATLVSGPSPASVSALAPNGSAGFTWTYRVSGNAGDQLTFTVQASALRNGTPISSDPVGTSSLTIVLFTLAANPTALLSGATSRTIAYTVFNGGPQAINKVQLLTPDPAFTVAANPFASDTSGWAGTTSSNPKGYVWTAPTGQSIAPQSSKTFTLSYASVGPVTVTTGYLHRFEMTQADTTTVRADAVVSLFINRAIPEVGTLVALSTNGKNTLTWNDPVDHDGVLVLRQAGSPPSTAPVPGQQYFAGQTLGAATVVYADSASFSSSFDDTGLTNGTTYYYRVYNHDLYFLYAPGNAPSSSGIFGIPTTGGSGNPTWCYNSGFSSGLQPMIDYGAGVFNAGNAKFISGNVSSPGSATDGTEKWRPAVLQGAVQNRFQVVPLAGRTGSYIVTGDQSGFATVISAATGSLTFKGNGGAALGTRIQAQPAVQLLQYSNAAYSAAFPSTDLLIFATADTGTGNKVVALKSTDGTVAWTYAPGDLAMVSGGMVLDTTTNWLWVASRAGGVGTLRVLNSLNGTLKSAWSVGDVDLPLSYDAPSNQIFVTNNAGVVYGFDASLTAATEPVWQSTVGTQSSYAYPTGHGFIASLASSLQWFKVSAQADGGTTVAPQWSPAPALTGPTGIRIDYGTPQKIYVGDSAGVLHQLDLVTGVEDTTKRRQISSSGLGTPTIDPYFASGAKRLYVNSLDGRLCAIEVPY